MASWLLKVFILKVLKVPFDTKIRRSHVSTAAQRQSAERRARLGQQNQISLKSAAAFKERSSGKLVEPAGNKIQADPFPPCTPCNDTSAELTSTAPSFTDGKNCQKKKRLFKR